MDRLYTEPLSGEGLRAAFLGSATGGGSGAGRDPLEVLTSLDLLYPAADASGVAALSDPLVVDAGTAASEGLIRGFNAFVQARLQQTAETEPAAATAAAPAHRHRALIYTPPAVPRDAASAGLTRRAFVEAQVDRRMRQWREDSAALLGQAPDAASAADGSAQARAVLPSRARERTERCLEQQYQDALSGYAVDIPRLVRLFAARNRIDRVAALQHLAGAAAAVAAPIVPARGRERGQGRGSGKSRGGGRGGSTVAPPEAASTSEDEHVQQREGPSEAAAPPVRPASGPPAAVVRPSSLAFPPTAAAVRAMPTFDQLRESLEASFATADAISFVEDGEPASEAGFRGTSAGLASALTRERRAAAAVAFLPPPTDADSRPAEASRDVEAVRAQINALERSRNSLSLRAQYRINPARLAPSPSAAHPPSAATGGGDSWSRRLRYFPDCTLGGPSTASLSASLRAADVVFRVALFHPRCPQPEQEFEALGTDTLEALRDCIYCLSDRMPLAESRAASMFCIEGVCFDDRRPGRELLDYRAHRRDSAVAAGPVSGPEAASGPDAKVRLLQLLMEDAEEGSCPAAPIDKYLSDSVIRWARSGKGGSGGPLVARGMAETRFADLSVRLGAHYLFCHQGDCEHILVFTDIRLATASVDPPTAAYFPRPVFRAHVKRRICMACRARHAVWQVYGDKWAEASPAYYCDGCHRSIHCNADGTPRYTDYQVFPFYHY
jgi:hypothetical protein